MTFKTFAFLLIMAIFSSCNTNIYLVRHAEKLNATNTSPLTPEGEQRAIALRDSLKNKRIDSVFTTIYHRTQLTAKPLADAIGKKITTYKPDDRFSARLKDMKGKNVLVVGHSNTIPETIKYITGQNVTIAEDDFDNLYIIRIRRFFKTKITLESKTYGAVSP